MRHRDIQLSVLVAISVLLMVPSQGFADNNGRGDRLPPGVQDNRGLSGNGQGDTQGNHYGWYKNHGQDTQTGSNPSQSDSNGPGDNQKFNRGDWLKNHPEAREAMEQRRQQRQQFMQNHPEMREGMEQRREQRQQFMQNHPEMREGMEQRRDQRQQFMQNHPDAREAMQNRLDGNRFHPGNGGQGNDNGHSGNQGQWQHHPNGNAYGNGQVSGNGGQMGNSHSPHRH